jgi:hypothetical protein
MRDSHREHATPCAAGAHRLERQRSYMAFISFVAPYRPIVCGIADYTEFITRESPDGSWDVVSFDPLNYGVPLGEAPAAPDSRVWHGIPSRESFSARSIRTGLKEEKNPVLWFQHEFGIWKDSARFVSMLRDLHSTKVVTPHSLHFESDETPYGLHRKEHRFLSTLLPFVDAMTVFSDGVCRAVNWAFPEHRDKIHVLRHGIHQHTRVSRMHRAEAKQKVHEHLMRDPRVRDDIKTELASQRFFLDPEITLVGAAGFVTASKGVEVLFETVDMLQRMLPGGRMAAVYVGHLRQTDNPVDNDYAECLRAKCSSGPRLFIETYLPDDMLATLLRALDVFFYWPSDCTQSGIIAHALGAGATVACRDMEGVGETVRMAGGLTSCDFEQMVLSLKDLILGPRLGTEMAHRALRYAEAFSWGNQAHRHFELAGFVQRAGSRPLFSTHPVGSLPAQRGVAAPRR